MKKLLLKISERWKSETPKLWKRVRNIATAIGVISTAILTAELAAGIDVSDTYKKLLAYGIAIGAGVGAISQLQKQKDKDDENNG